MRAICRSTVTALGIGLLLLTLAGHATAAASPPGSDEAMMPSPPRDGDGAMVPPPPPSPGEEGEMMPPLPPPPGGKVGWQHKGKISKKDMEELNLTPEQQQKIKAQRKEQGSAMKSLRESLKAKHEELRAEIDKEKSDTEKIGGITAELKKFEAQRIDQEVKGILQMKEMLSPEQFKKLGDMREKREGEKRGRKGKRKGHWRGRGGDDDGEKEQHEACVATPQPQSTPAAAPAVTGSN